MKVQSLTMNTKYDQVEAKLRKVAAEEDYAYGDVLRQVTPAISATDTFWQLTDSAAAKT